ncbi:hypothetical protein SNE40_021431 [Patella caerulea]|uniref:DUF4371 domain-containing protein n=1 Tax=Patella caerulea TaxID=87958 RepID=A0AAN8G7P1_PATCE
MMLRLLTGEFGKTVEGNTAPYGIHPMFQNTAQIQEPAPVPLTPLNDRIINAETMIIGFTSENSLSFSAVPAIINLAKALAADKKALDGLSMNRTTASYKTQFGIGKTFQDQLVTTLISTPFSFNMDESTSSNFQKVLTILVTYFCPQKKNQVVVQHFASLSCIKVNTESLYNEVVALMEKHNIPWKNLRSVLMDSCNVMRGSKAGLEVRLRSEKAAHLLDIDGDVCRHVHNAAKAFCKPFKWSVEQLYNDLFNDFKWSPDLREFFQENCEMLQIKYTMPQRYVSHRWLSVYDVTLDTLRLFDCMTIFYFPWISKSEQLRYVPTVVEIYHRLRVSESSTDRITEIRKELVQKKLTKRWT